MNELVKQKEWRGYDNIKLSKRGLRIASILSKDFEFLDFHLKECKNGLVIVDFFNYGLVGSNLTEQIYSELGMFVSALEPLNDKVRVWFGDRTFCNKSDFIHPIHRITVDGERRE